MVKLLENQAIMIKNDIWSCLFIQTLLHILCILVEHKINIYFKNTLSKDHQNVKNQTKVPRKKFIKGVFRRRSSSKMNISKIPHSSKKEYIKNISQD